MKDEQKLGNKLLSLKEAVKQYVKPGLKLHLAGGLGGPGAAICEIIRQFRGTTPGFELIQSTITGHAINLVHCGLVKKLIFSAGMEIAASAHPSKVIQTAYSEKKIDFENWSLLTLQQKLMAGAMGLSFMPTRSISGSNLALDNRDNFKEIGDPFNPGNKAGIVKAINPDLSIVHGSASDIFGNTILSAPYGEDVWGSLASTGGVIVTVEKIIPTEEIIKYSSIIRIPSSIVKAVCHAPMGLHPFAFANPAFDGIEPYRTDTEFLEELHEAFSDPNKLDEWIDRWVIKCADQKEYLNKLGARRISSLKKGAKAKKKKAVKKTYKQQPAAADGGYTADEMLLIASSREITESILKSDHKTMLVGAGSRSLAAILAYYELRRRNYEIELITGNGQFGYTPPPGETSLQTIESLYSSKMLSDTVTTYSVLVGGKNGRCLSVLGAGQIDKFGNINSSRTSDGGFLVGTGGANDAVNANEVIIILNQSKKRFVNALPYITAKGYNVSKVISTLGIFVKAPGKSELSLYACFPIPPGVKLEEAIRNIHADCSWPLKSPENVHLLPGPTRDELQLLRFLLAR